MTQPISSDQLQGGHGGQGSQESNFTRLLRNNVDYQPLALSDPNKVFGQIAKAMDQGVDDPSDTPDDQENPYVPAGYTYLGQLVDHDLTFDTRSTLDNLPAGLSSFPDDERTPRFDLDCIYGEGPGSSAFMYDADGRLATNPNKPFDLPRAPTLFSPADPTSHRAIIGDPRNDENSIVCQLQLAFINFHNKLIDTFKSHGLSGAALFHRAQKEVRFSYQQILVTDFLKRIVQKKVYDDFTTDYLANGNTAFKLYKPGPARAALPLEFTGAAYRFGHSGVRNAYRLNDGFQKRIFDGSDDAADSLVGFGDLPDSHKIDWTLFFTKTLAPGDKANNSGKKPDGTDVESDKRRLQFAYKLDTSLVDPLAHLPSRISGTGDTNALFASLAARNLKRGYNFNLPSGQDFERVLGVANGPPLLIGESLSGFKDLGISSDDAAALEKSTPLWLYILAESQACLADASGKFPRKEGKIDKDSNAGTQLGPVGGRIILEVFFGLLDSDSRSYFWEPSWTPAIKSGAKALTMWDVMSFIAAV
jgi:hypothetical protein